ncbi:aa3-type cytochrome oxidase subunit II [Brevibacterium litoralis]|uniref:aa3-type cytochrome oxidase subunit II n=1 Tax=Brevibacterium litoralis TaxID=3138935 RepID=UPI003D9AAA29
MLGAVATTMLLAGCTREQWEVGYLPVESKGATSHTDHYIALWNGGWIAALAVGVVTWGLILWCLVAYRRKKSDRGLPRQLAYNMPVEILFTVMPIVLVIGFFFQTVNTMAVTTDENSEQFTASTQAEQTIEVVGKQWAWDFNYVTENRYYAGVQANLDGTEAPGDNAPTLYLPANTSINFEIRSRDVVHSFWVPAFLEKMDMIPGKTNHMHLTPLKEGSYVGKCAELCGEFHSEMLFNVEVVSPEEFDRQMQQLEQGQLGPEYDRTEWYQNPYEQEEGEH